MSDVSEHDATPPSGAQEPGGSRGAPASAAAAGDEPVDVPDAVRAKEALLAEWLRAHAHPALAIGFSGGVDSTYLAAVAADAAGPARVVAVIGTSASLADDQHADARALAARLGVRVVDLATHEMADPRYVANPSNRCYFCKSELWTRVRAWAAEQGVETIADGTNADDVRGHRPGAVAGRERGVHSPLAHVGLGKDEIRILSRARGLPTWDAPSSPCLASRLPYGTPVTHARLRQVEGAERALRALGLAGDLRVRHHGELARVELSRAELGRWLSPAGMRAIRSAVRQAGFARVAVDLRGFRSGSLNVLEGVTAA
ncbi:MAG TPA: ATP-dependent sacrificial sulfur transferase LarE [Gemmatimonadaceae bacterium]|nr:ATP-dependent sacrificial sulfur transferase LarE [Gemmatimonadaceae bacterium]